MNWQWIELTVQIPSLTYKEVEIKLQSNHIYGFYQQEHRRYKAWIKWLSPFLISSVASYLNYFIFMVECRHVVSASYEVYLRKAERIDQMSWSKKMQSRYRGIIFVGFDWEDTWKIWTPTPWVYLLLGHHIYADSTKGLTTPGTSSSYTQHSSGQSVITQHFPPVFLASVTDGESAQISRPRRLHLFHAVEEHIWETSVWK